MDYRQNGHIYLGYVYPKTGRDSLKILRSTDGGASWYQFAHYYANPGRKFTDVALICGNDSLLVFIPQDTARGPYRDYLAFLGYAGGSRWANFSDTTRVPNGVLISVDADRNANGDTMMVVYEADSSGVITGFGVMATRDRGASWLWRMASIMSREPKITWINGRRWAIVSKAYYSALSRKRTFINVSNDGGMNFSSFRLDTMARDTLNIDPSITACRSTGRVFITVTHITNAGNYDIWGYQAKDAGDSSYLIRFTQQPTGNQHLSALSCLRFGVTGWLDMAFQDSRGDSIVRFASQYGDSGSWGTGQIVSDHRSSNYISPKIAYCPDGSHQGPAVFYAGYNENGIYMNAQWLTGVECPSTTLGVPTRFKLEQNAPNPVHSGRTTISFSLPEESEISLEIFNVLGQRVSTLVNGKLKAGRHTVSWNGTVHCGAKVASGVYLFQLKAERITLTRRMTVVR